jgi:twitching motility two-component system response regulator PilG
MRGSLNEIDIRSILQLIELGQRTGELLIEAPALNSQVRSWFVFFIHGKIVYAIELDSRPLARLQDYLYPDQIKVKEELVSDLALEAVNVPEYAYLWQLIVSKTLSTDRGCQILRAMILETLFDLLSLSKGDFIFSQGVALSPSLLILEINPVISQIMQQKQNWRQFYPHVQHLDQFISLTHPEELASVLPERAYSNLSQWAKRRLTLRQLSRYLRREPVIIARNLYPYAQRGWLRLVNATDAANLTQPATLIRSPRILLIDDDLSIRKKVENILESHNYLCSIFGDSLEALSQAIAIEPDLILCDIALPQLDGYQLCHLWRQTKALGSTPIIMLTSQEGLLARVKAKMVGATDYLTKPFGEIELLLLLEKYLSHFQSVREIA